MSNYDKKPFPWKCSNCGELAVAEAIIDYSTTMYHDGREYTVRVERLKAAKCGNCGKPKVDVEALDTLDAEFRRMLVLLTPEQIQQMRLKLNLSRHELAAAIAVDDYVVEQLESGGQIQSRSLDDLMRRVFGLPQMIETTHLVSSLPFPMTPQP